MLPSRCCIFMFATFLACCCVLLWLIRDRWCDDWARCIVSVVIDLLGARPRDDIGRLSGSSCALKSPQEPAPASSSSCGICGRGAACGLPSGASEIRRIGSDPARSSNEELPRLVREELPSDSDPPPPPPPPSSSIGVSRLSRTERRGVDALRPATT